MSSLRNPVGPESPATYWKRRAAVLVALLLLLALIGFAISRLFNGPSSDSAGPTTSPTGSVSASPSTSGATTGPSGSASTSSPAPSAPACNPADVVLTATTDKGSYVRTGSAVMGMTIMNKGTADCSLDVGSQALELTVYTGNERIWSSDDCQQNPASQFAVVKPGPAGTLASRVTWNLRRSAQNCPSNAATQAQLQPGTYKLIAREGDHQSTPKVFQITAK